MKLRLFAHVFLAFFVYLLTVHFYQGIISGPTEGDSLAYHIPLANAIVTGEIIEPALFQASPFLKYSPASSELFLASFVFFGVPLTLYNVLGVVVLFFAARFVALQTGLSRDFSVVFAVTICSLNGIVRWMNTQIIDIWLLVFFLFSLGLLIKPERSLRYFLLLGISIGMLCGTKFTGPVFAAILFCSFANRIWGSVTFKRFFVFLLPFSLFGLPWYLRNFFLKGNPIYPQPIFGLPGEGDNFGILNVQVWRVLTTYPTGTLYTLNGYIAEYGIFTLSFFLCIAYILLLAIKKAKTVSLFLTLFFIGFCVLVVYLFLPSALEEHIAVSVFRYSYAAFVLFILCIFLLAQKFKREEMLSFIALSNIFILGFPMFYYPKLVFVYIPITLSILYFDSIKQHVLRKVKAFY